MTAIIVVGSILLLIFFLLASFITADLEYDGVFKFKIKYLFFTIAKDPLSPKEIEKKKRKEEKKKLKEKKKTLNKKKQNASEKKPDPRQETQDTRKRKKTKSESPPKNISKEKKDKNSKITPDLVIRIIKRASPHVKRIFKKICFDKIYVDITVGGDDAAKTAISYGAHCAAIDGLAAFLDNTVSFKAEKIGISADFDLEKSKYYAKGRIKLRLSTLLHSGIWGALAVLSELKNLNAESERSKMTATK